MCAQTFPVPGTSFGIDQEADADAVVSHLFTARCECSFLLSRGSQMWGSFTVVLGMQLLVELGANVLACWGC